LTEELAELNNRDRVPVTFGSVIETWANRTNAPKKGKQDRTTKANWFCRFPRSFGYGACHPKNCIDYLDAMIEGEVPSEKGEQLSRKSISNDVKESKSLFGWATDNVEGIPSNPWERIRPDSGKGEDRDDFTTEERRAILTAAREACPVIRWCNWLPAFHGFRNSENCRCNHPRRGMHQWDLGYPDSDAASLKRSAKQD
jgi:hypothetical protein